LSARRIAFAVPGALDRPTGGSRYDRRVIVELGHQGIAVEVVQLADTFPAPSALDLSDAEAAIAALPAGLPVIVDGLAFAVMGEAAARLAVTRPLIALVHHPLALETGLTPEEAAAFRNAEQDALRHAAAVVVTSAPMAALLATDYAVARRRIHIAPPGVDRPDPLIVRHDHTPIRFLTVGSLIPRKGHGDLIAAFAAIRDLDWQAEIVGDATMNPAHASDLAHAIRTAGLDDRVRLTGALDEAAVARRYAEADCFVLASHYEGYGMAYMEAIAAGLPVIGTTGAAEAIGNGGAMIAPGDVAALTTLLRGFVTDAGARAGLRARATAAARTLPQWDDTARVVVDLVGGLEAKQS